MNDLILKLIYAGFTTKQLHQYYRQFGCFDFVTEKYEMLLREGQDERLRAKLQCLKKLDSTQIRQNLSRDQIQTVFYHESDYPVLLKEIYDFPFVLFYRGDIKLAQNKALAIVGGRERTDYTKQVLTRLMPELRDLTIVSGLAKGTDADAHLAAMEHGSRTIGVLGFGHLHHYPSETALLRRHMEEHQLVVSEYPPFAGPKTWQFPERNRLISGLAEGVLVIESKKRSGSLITLDQALDQNRNVYCIPGPVTSQYSEGSNLKIFEGAKMCLKASDILEDFIV
ncbi:DNA-protecting protein DprA [Macrococcus brunensis]|uniref:DNA-protecting protein DprA n=1 Tax=Macrococcus brunensis TaxID=198483 RepID=A0A4R6BDE6_9STAP|nr:DNA-processing protein DprA [Macrococcus brunensis]TDL97745.1 DNA-protecting protein DprA [Macrococcus brunensis]ULG72898.1 DNA-processing protein DprA [Macrococcus brunensis]